MREVRPGRSRHREVAGSLQGRIMDFLQSTLGRNVVGSGVAVVAALSLLLVIPGARDELAISFTQRPEGYTELYFTDNRDDLVVGPDGRLKVLVTFAIANNGDPYGPAYTYRVRVRGAAGRPVAEMTEPLAIESGERRHFSVALDVPDAAAWSAVDVSLVGRPGYIQDFAPIGGP
jgi:hypothetical protein